MSSDRDDQHNGRGYSIEVFLVEASEPIKFEESFYSVQDGWLRIFTNTRDQEAVEMFPSESVHRVSAVKQMLGRR